MSETAATPVIDVRPIPKPQRHLLIFDALEKLAVGRSLVVLNDHNPIPLRGQVEAIYGSQFSWRYIEEGPHQYRLQFTRREPAPGGLRRPETKIRGQSSTQIGNDQAHLKVIAADLASLAATATHSGPQWAHESEDLDVTFLCWEAGRAIEAHINNEVDVVWIGVAGEGVAIVDGVRHALQPGGLLLIPKGCERGIESGSGVCYLSLHRRRRGLMPTLNGKTLTGA